MNARSLVNGVILLIALLTVGLTARACDNDTMPTVYVECRETAANCVSDTPDPRTTNTHPPDSPVTPSPTLTPLAERASKHTREAIEALKQALKDFNSGYNQ